jgi:hypothetical protein
MAPDTTFNANATFSANGNLQNQGSASVLYLQDGPAAAGCPSGATGCNAPMRAANAGLFFAFPALNANPNVVAIDEASGFTVWTAHVGIGSDGVPASDGIRGTPVIDPVARLLYLVSGSNPHVVHALSVDTGVEVTTNGWPVTLSSATVSFQGTTFNSGIQNQHGALILVNGILYIPFGGYYGDTPPTYRGWLVAVNTKDTDDIGAWVTQSPRSGIWGSGGPVSDGVGVFAVTGDSTNTTRPDSDSEEVVRLTGMAVFDRQPEHGFVPTEWESWDQPIGDLDFGASTPAYVPLPSGSSPSSILVAPAKAGRLYILDATNLSSGKFPMPGGELQELVISDINNSEAVYTSPTIYTSASGLHATVNVGAGAANCPGGNPSTGEALVSVLIQPGHTPIATEVWCAPNSQGGHHLNYMPISTPTDGVSADALVWFMNGSQLAAVDGDTGAPVVTTSGDDCDNIPSMSFPIAVNNRIVIAALGHLCSWSPNGQ